MKKYLLLVLSTFMAISTWAQVLTISPESVTVMDISTTVTDAPAHSTLTNTGNTQRTIIWEKNVIEKTDEWDIAVCDKNNCYFPGVDSKTVILDAGTETNLDVHAYPKGVEGYAIVEMYNHDAADSTVQVTGYYYFNYDPNRSKEVMIKRKITLFPNPTRNSFSLKEQNEETSQVVIINLLGQELKRFDAKFETSFDISTLAKGNYLVQILDQKGRTQATKLLQKM